jgi:Ni,Fe-hydrogenase III large subunit
MQVSGERNDVGGSRSNSASVLRNGVGPEIRGSGNPAMARVHRQAGDAGWG